MNNPEILLLAGAPGSGKSSIAKRFLEKVGTDHARHLSVGDLKRSIVAGETPSAYAELLQKKEQWDPKNGTAPREAMIGIIEEFMLASPTKLTLLDGFPRYMDRVGPFQESMHKIGGNILALCRVEVPHGVLVDRLGGREAREHELIKDPLARLTDHYENIVPTLERLGDDYPVHTLDGTQPLDVNAAKIAEIYRIHTI